MERLRANAYLYIRVLARNKGDGNALTSDNIKEMGRIAREAIIAKYNDHSVAFENIPPRLPDKIHGSHKFSIPDHDFAFNSGIGKMLSKDFYDRVNPKEMILASNGHSNAYTSPSMFVSFISSVSVPGIKAGVGTIVVRFSNPCFGRNSFTADTLVNSLYGLIPISSLSIGTPVLAFNEYTGENGFYSITAVYKNVDPAITYLVITDPEQGNKPEYITTTPEHPFYLKEGNGKQVRPKPIGHEDLNSNWVGAGHLKVGDKIKQADGTTGVVANVVTVRQTQEMFNLTVETAHTFYVGTNGWLVHNCNGLKAGQVVEDVSKLGKELANDVDEFFLALRNFKIYTTVAATEVNGVRYITINGGSMKNKKLIEELSDLASKKGYRFIDNDKGSMHAERFLYEHFDGKVESIGISHYSDPCKELCRLYFSDKPVELVWNGTWKR